MGLLSELRVKNVVPAVVVACYCQSYERKDICHKMNTPRLLKKTFLLYLSKSGFQTKLTKAITQFLAHIYTFLCNSDPLS